MSAHAASSLSILVFFRSLHVHELKNQDGGHAYRSELTYRCAVLKPSSHLRTKHKHKHKKLMCKCGRLRHKYKHKPSAYANTRQEIIGTVI